MDRGDRLVSASDFAVLALVAEAPTHGWAIATQLARGGELGAISSVGRPVVYHSLARLEAERLIVTVGIERGSRGPHRVNYDATEAGRAAVSS
jgi:PadR family transcriptional regulator AphA